MVLRFLVILCIPAALLSVTFTAAKRRPADVRPGISTDFVLVVTSADKDHVKILYERKGFRFAHVYSFKWKKGGILPDYYGFIFQCIQCKESKIKSLVSTMEKDDTHPFLKDPPTEAYFIPGKHFVDLPNSVDLRDKIVAANELWSSSVKYLDCKKFYTDVSECPITKLTKNATEVFGNFSAYSLPKKSSSKGIKKISEFFEK
ncbi:uncharacterized protein LOC129592501 [Paramacrobiotus metropolitanus]|uniref:uncharacterized protein LOC129592501 n=1 Tax=Paramacrobiotus metropolitanus TaxID=2943436 RepID=UPI002445CBBA|nr:uncharacterized protein LOC129592501 [Paramacrobiotus metropolitanus]